MTKKSIFIISIIVVIAGLFIYRNISTFLKNDNSDVSETPVVFSFQENLAVKFGEIVPIQFENNSNDVVKVELYYNDSLFQTWNNPSEKEIFKLEADYYGLGTKSILLKSYLKNGNQFQDTRMIRVLSDIAPKNIIAEIIKTYPHDPTNFTQGFEFSDGKLYESTGQRGESKVMQVNLENGKAELKNALDANYFGEGITILNDLIYQLTWQEQRCFVYDKNNLVLQKDLNYTGEGWGICNDGENLIMSDGSERLTFRDPKTFRILKTIEVFDQVGPRNRLNELEYINGYIFANVWMLDIVLVIDPISGKVLAELDCSAVSQLGRGKGEVLNGIAYNQLNGKLYLTGKNWDKVIEIKFPDLN